MPGAWRAGRVAAACMTCVALCGLMTGCGRSTPEAAAPLQPAAGRVAAKVNGEPILFDQLRDIEGVAADDAVDATALDRMIDLSVLAQAARSQGLDKDPEVARRMEFASRRVLARAYLDQQASAGLKPPAAADARRYYDEHPELFAARRVYQLRELRVTLPALPRPEAEALLEQMRAAAGSGTLDRLLATRRLPATERQLQEPAERLPLAALKELAKLSPGKTVVVVEALDATGKAPTRVRALTLQAARPAPRVFDEALPSIMAYLHHERLRAAGREHVAQLRSGAQILKYAADPLLEPAYAAKPASR